MPNCSRRHIVRFTKAVLQRNVNLRKALEFFIDNQVGEAEDLGAMFGFRSASTGRGMIRELVEQGLIEFSHYEGAAGRSLGAKYYRLVAGAESRYQSIFPVEEYTEPSPFIDLTKMAGGLFTKVHVVDEAWRPKKPQVIKVYRDPLHIALMGFGRAPSLNFMESQSMGV